MLRVRDSIPVSGPVSVNGTEVALSVVIGSVLAMRERVSVELAKHV